MLVEAETLDGFDETHAAIALVLADVVDDRGPNAVAAARELASILAHIRELADADIREFLAAVRTPIVGLAAQ